MTSRHGALDCRRRGHHRRGSSPCAARLVCARRSPERASSAIPAQVCGACHRPAHREPIGADQGSVSRVFFVDFLQDPVLATLFSNCLPNTLDTTVEIFTNSTDPLQIDTYIVTGCAALHQQEREAHTLSHTTACMHLHMYTHKQQHSLSSEVTSLRCGCAIRRIRCGLTSGMPRCASSAS